MRGTSVHETTMIAYTVNYRPFTFNGPTYKAGLVITPQFTPWYHDLAERVIRAICLI